MASLRMYCFTALALKLVGLYLVQRTNARKPMVEYVVNCGNSSGNVTPVYANSAWTTLSLEHMQEEEWSYCRISLAVHPDLSGAEHMTILLRLSKLQLALENCRNLAFYLQWSNVAQMVTKVPCPLPKYIWCNRKTVIETLLSWNPLVGPPSLFVEFIAGSSINLCSHSSDVVILKPSGDSYIFATDEGIMAPDNRGSCPPLTDTSLLLRSAEPSVPLLVEVLVAPENDSDRILCMNTWCPRQPESFLFSPGSNVTLFYNVTVHQLRRSRSYGFIVKVSTGQGKGVGLQSDQMVVAYLPAVIMSAIVAVSVVTIFS